MSVFEPDHIIAVAKLLQGGTRTQKQELEDKWREKVERRWRGWQNNRPTQSQYVPQLEWASHVVEYVSWVYNLTKSAKGGTAPLRADVPFLGPRFLPPSYLQVLQRKSAPDIQPETAYLKPLTIIHPLYFDGLAKCPRCDAVDSEVVWSGWTPTGHCEVHGLDREETALGYQLRCKRCQNTKAKSSKNGEGSYCFTTTNYTFWERREHWQIPRGIPVFTKRCALSGELFDLIVEFRLTMTSAGLADHIKQLHLYRYHQERSAYLSAYKRRLEESGESVFPTLKSALRPFSKPEDIGGYSDVSITDDFITDIYLKFSRATRVEESNEHLRTLTAVSVSIDQTFRAAGKAKLVNSAHKHEKAWGGGILNALNERGQTLAWVSASQAPISRASGAQHTESDVLDHNQQQFCQTQANAEIQEFLHGIKRRFLLLGVPAPEIVVADNCCHVRKAIKSVFPNAHVALDVWHMLMRYNACVLGGSGNHARPEIADDIVSAILKTRADKYNPAMYWTQEEQEKRLEAAFKKWAARGVWNMAAAKTHSEQMKHVKKGCLTRPRNDIRSDGSRIEGTHKAWNSLQRSYASGLEMLTMLSHDLVLRRNHRIDLESGSPTPFALSTFGSHHLRLVNQISILWNSILQTHSPSTEHLFASLEVSPTFHSVNSGETFGIVQSQFATDYQYMVDIKTEPTDDLLDLTAQSPQHAQRILESLNIDPTLLSQPLSAPFAAIDGSSSTFPSTRHKVDDDIMEVSATGQSLSAGPSSIPGDLTAKPIKDDVHSPCTAQTSTASLTQSTLAVSAARIDTSELESSVSLQTGTQADTLAFTAITLPRRTDTSDPEGAISLQIATQSDTLMAGLLRHHTDTSEPESSILVQTGTQADARALSVASSECRTGISEPKSIASRSRSPHPNHGNSTRSKRPRTVDNTPVPSDVQHDRGPSKKLKLAARPELYADATTISSAGTTSSSAAAAHEDKFLLLAQRSNTVLGASSAEPTISARREQTALTQRNRDIQDYFAVGRGSTTSSPAERSRPDHCKLPRIQISGLTPSQRVFSIATGLNPLARAITSGDEFFLFMNLRAEHKWTSYSMTPSANTELEKLNRRLGHASWTVSKTPRALMVKLSEVETMVLRRLAAGDYKSKDSGKEDFWRKHCHAVPLFKGGSSDLTKRKINTCTRCKAIMWPGPKGSPLNHKRAFCSDGVRMKSQVNQKTSDGRTAIIVEDLPPWPQPSGIFEEGTTFHPTVFLRTVAQLYTQVVAHNSTGGEYAMEYLAFAEMLHKRTIVVAANDTTEDSSRECTEDGGGGSTATEEQQILFRLFDSLVLGPCPPQLLVTYKGARYLSVTPLLESGLPTEEEEEEEEEGGDA